MKECLRADKQENQSPHSWKTSSLIHSFWKIVGITYTLTELKNKGRMGGRNGQDGVCVH